jgi:non-heme chloroperoxidase
MAKKEICIGGFTYTLSYELLNLHQEKTIVFLHGWGSNKAIMKQAFGKTLPQYKHLYLDLPGFGDSSIPKVLTTDEYANIVKYFLETLHIVPHTLLGHSFGGKIAILLKPTSLILLSSAGILTQKAFKVKAKIALFKLFKSFVPRHFYRFFASKDVEGMSQMMYETFKRVVDEDFSELFFTCKSKTTIFWGIEDLATPLLSGEKIHHLIQKSAFYPLSGDHFFFIKQHKAIEKILLESGY